MKTFDIVIIGAGASGSMAAIRAKELKKEVALLEKNISLGKKLLITGKGRCNITNTAPLDTFVEEFGKTGSFLRSALFKFSNQDLIDFFEKNNLKLKTERQGRVFPVTDKASSVVELLKRVLQDKGVEVFYDNTISSIKKEGESFVISINGKEKVLTKKVILATGGVSYKTTGSTGDGINIAKEFGHKITPLRPALVPIKTKENWVNKLKGLSLRNVRVVFKAGKKKIKSSVGEMIFTHFGVSGPLILDLSGKITELFDGEKKVNLLIDLKPGLTEEKIKEKFIREFRAKGKTHFKNIMKDILPIRLAEVFLELTNIDSEKLGNQITQKERQLIIENLKALPLTVTGSLPLEEAMVTQGGVSTKEINPRTMESRLVPGLYFAGEIIEGAAKSGGYNLQQAFSTGFLAGEEAAKCVK